MHFLLADTFTDSLSRLTGEEQKLVKITALDLQINPANPGHQFHRIDKAKDRNFWSVRVGSDQRLIIHAVVVRSCDDEVLPLQSRIAAITDDTNLERVCGTERHLLYVACTRARDLLW